MRPAPSPPAFASVCTPRQLARMDRARDSLVERFLAISPTTNTDHLHLVCDAICTIALHDCEKDPEKLASSFVRLCGDDRVVAREMRLVQDSVRNSNKGGTNGRAKSRAKSRAHKPKPLVPDNQTNVADKHWVHSLRFEYEVYYVVLAVLLAGYILLLRRDTVPRG